MKYLDKDWKTTIKDKAKYAFIDNGILLRKISKEAIDLPIFNVVWEFWNKKAIISNKDTVIQKLTKNIKPNRWKLIWWQVDNWGKIKIWEWKKEVYDLTIKNTEPSIKDLSILSKALQLISKDLELNWDLAELKEKVNSLILPEDVGAKLFVDEIENQEVFVSNELGIVLDIRNKDDNISWNVFDCLYRLAKWSITKLNKLLQQFWIDGIEETDIYYMYNISDTHKIEFRKDGVYSIKTNWDAEVESVIIDKPLKLVGWYESNYDVLNNVITDIKKRYYYFEWDIIFPYYQNTDHFNKRLWWQWIRMMTTWKTFQMFYSALDQWIDEDNIPEFKIVEHNWIDLEKKIFVHWWQMLYKDTDEEFKVFAPKYATTIWEQITIQEAKKIMKWYLREPYHYIIFLWFLWAFLKKDLFQQWIPTPILQVIWFTESGKTETIQMMMKLVGLSPTPIKDGNVTIQPRAMTLEGTRTFAVQNELWDYAPIFFDEFTWNISSEIEEMLRWVYNEKDAKKGRADQSVVTYNMLSPVVIGWEKAPKYMSVMNRSIYVQLDKSLHTDKETYKKIRKSLNWKSVLADMWDKVKDVDLSKYKDWIDNWEARIDNNYAWLRIVNDIYKVFSKEELETIIEKTSKIHRAIIEGKDELKEFFVKTILYNKKEQSINIRWDVGEEVTIDLYIPEELGSKHHAIQAIKQLVKDDTSENQNIVINISRLLKERDKRTEWIVQYLFRYLANYKNRLWQAFMYEFIN